MCNILIHSTIHHALTLIAFLFLICRVNADDEEMHRIREAHQKWVQSIVSLHLTCEIEFDPFSQDNRQHGTTGQHVTHILEWAWNDGGRFRHHSKAIRDGKMESRMLFLDDAERSYRVHYSYGESTENHPKEVAIGPSHVGSEGIVMPLFGLWYNRRSQWLGELLDAGLGKHQGYEIVDGVNCPKLDVERAPGIIVTVVLDPRHEYLPVIARTGKKIWQQKVNTFRELKPGVWFPDSGQFLTEIDGAPYSKETWRITKVDLNRNIPVSLFRPKIPKGTAVIDSLKGERYRQGMPRRKSSPRQISQEAKENNPIADKESGISAVPRPFFWRRWGATVLLLLSISFLGIATWLWRRNTNAKSVSEN